MQVHTELPSQPILERCALTVGTFDGVHCGHQRLVEVLRQEARLRNLPAAALTFADMPFCYFRPDECPQLLTLPHEKIAAFDELGLDHLFIVPFNEQIAQQSYATFATEVLCEAIGAKLLVIGPDFALGKSRQGTVAALTDLGQQVGFETKVLAEKIQFEQLPISSTRVRSAVENGEVENAMKMLGRAFAFEGEVVAGKQLGRTIGVPTINLQTHPRKVLPAKGIYAARVSFDKSMARHAPTLPAALSIGTNPTVSENSSVKVEFYVIGENIETPPKQVRVEVLAWLRGERKFDSLDALVAQMQRDIAQARSILS